MKLLDSINLYNSKNDILIKNEAMKEMLSDRSELLTQRNAEIESAVEAIKAKYNSQIADIEESITLMLTIGNAE